MKPKKILGANEISTILNRLSFQLIEDHSSFKNTVLVGIQPRGSLLAKRIATLINNYNKTNNLKIGYLDITFFRDDFRRSEKVLKANSTKLDFSIENKTVVLVDDVLNSGSTLIYGVKHFLDVALTRFKTAVLVNRNHKKYPVKADFKGISLSTSIKEHIQVDFSENDAIAYLK